MISFNDLENGLNQRLTSAVGLPTIAWPSAPELYEPILGTPFIVPTLLNNTGELLTLDGVADTVGGVYSLLLSYPRGKGMTDLNNVVDIIRTHFAADRQFDSGSTRIIIGNISRSPILQSDQWQTATVSVGFTAVG